MVATDMIAALGDERVAQMQAHGPAGAGGRPRTRSPAAVGFLASRGAGYITGAVLPVDGGLGMGSVRADVDGDDRRTLTRSEMTVDSDAAFEKFQECAVEVLQVPADKVTKEARFADDLDADSLDLVELVMALEESFDITVDETELEDIETVGQAFDLVELQALMLLGRGPDGPVAGPAGRRHRPRRGHLLRPRRRGPLGGAAATRPSPASAASPTSTPPSGSGPRRPAGSTASPS